ncbi:MAG TPA: hypothetical protein VJ508_11365, partial [Saprospiraceae bacterium]|nr:hypothetical protein [Saprospiraceae bacterium]
LQQPADDRYQVSSTQPSYQVDLHVLGEGQVRVKCYCTVFKRTRHCRHAVAALFILRDQLLRRRKSKSKSAPGEEPVEAALRKMSITELRKFVAQYASSHASFKSELLAHHLHRTRKPDYATLLMELTPIDKYGQIKLNRNNIKNVRSTLSILLRQAQQLAFQKALPETFQILEAMITQLYRLIQKFPAYQAQLSVELKPALRLFETISQQPMAPRLQQTVIRWVKDISGRDSYFLFPGIHPLLRMVESFVLETSMRNSFIQLAEEKITTDPSERALWAGLWLRWKRLWPSKTQNRPMNNMVRSLAGEVLPALYQQKDFEDYVFTLELYWAELAKTKSFKNYLQLGLKASVIIDDHTMQVKTAAALSQQHFDLEAWRSLAIIDEGLARKIIHQTGQDFEPGQLREVDLFLLEGFTFFQEGDAL